MKFAFYERSAPNGFFGMSVLREFWGCEWDCETVVVWKTFFDQEALGEADSGKGLPLSQPLSLAPLTPCPGEYFHLTASSEMSVLREFGEREVDCKTAVISGVSLC